MKELILTGTTQVLKLEKSLLSRLIVLYTNTASRFYQPAMLTLAWTHRQGLCSTSLQTKQFLICSVPISLVKQSIMINFKLPIWSLNLELERDGNNQLLRGSTRWHQDATVWTHWPSVIRWS